MYISKRLKELRTASGFSQEKLAELLDVSRQTISSWENERSYPDVHNLIMLCDIYSVSLDDLMKGDIETMKKEVANTTLNKSPQDAIQLIQSGLVMIIGLLIAVTGLIITLNGGSTLWGYGLMIIGAALACFFAFYAVLRKYKGDGKPRTAQATIPYEAIYPDGVCRMQKRSTVYGSSGSAFTTTAWAPSRFQAHFLCRHLMCR